MTTAIATRRAVWLLATVVVGCAPIPSIEFFSDIGDGGESARDATLPSIDAAPSEDASDDAPADDPSDDGGAGEASIKCGAGFVTNCAQCAGAPLHCGKGAQNVCVADCNDCAPNWFPCFHCPAPDAAPRGSCLPVGASGQVACAATNLCACTTPTDCPVSAGAAQTCDLIAGAKAKRCETCGAPATAEAGCANASGAPGTCRLMEGAAPACR